MFKSIWKLPLCFQIKTSLHQSYSKSVLEFILFLFMRLRENLLLIRAGDYIKNLIIFVPVVFAQKAGDRGLWLPLLLTFLAFCLCSSFVYIFNDLHDRHSDRLHPVKCRRPLASGSIKPGNAIIVALLMLTAGIGLAASQNIMLLYILIIYIAQNILYTLLLKKVLILDILVIALGYLLRVYSGGLMANVPISYWLYIMTILLSLTISLGKRYDDLILSSTSEQYNVLQRRARYGKKLLYVLIAFTLISSMITYIIYTFDPSLPVSHNAVWYFLTIIPVTVGLGRYAVHIYRKIALGSPLHLLLSDRWILASMIVWTLMQFWFHS